MSLRQLHDALGEWEERRRAAKTPQQIDRELAWIHGTLAGGMLLYVLIRLVGAR